MLKTDATSDVQRSQTQDLRSIPPKIHDLIVDVLADGWHCEEDRTARNVSCNALRSCLLVSRSFCQRARYHVFRSIEMIIDTDQNGHEERFAALIGILSPPIGGGIAPVLKAFDLQILSKSHGFAGLPAAEKILNDTNFLSILRALDGRNRNYGLEKVSLHINSKGFDWTTLGADFQNGFRDLTYSPYLTSLHLHGFYNLPDSFLDGIYLLKFLHQGQFSMMAQSFSVAEDELLPPELTSLTTNHDIPLSDVDLMDVPHLKSFNSIVFLPDHLSRTWDILKTAVASLENLTLCFSESTECIPEDFDLGQLSQLQTLKIKLLETRSSVIGEDLDNICRLLEFPTNAESLHSIVIEISQDAGGLSTEPAIDSLKSNTWRLLDDILCHERYSSVRNVTLCLDFIYFEGIKCPTGEQDLEGDLRRFVLEALPTLFASSVEFTAEERLMRRIWDFESPAG